MVSQQLEGAFAIENKAQKFRKSRIGCLIAVFAMPGGIVLDYYVYPEIVPDLLMIRLASSLVLLLLLFAHRFSLARTHINVLAIIWPMIIEISTCQMIYLSGGAASPYYAGLNLVVICVTFLLPVTLVEALIFTTLTIVLYMLTCYLAGDIFEHFSVFYNNVNFLLLTGIICSFASHLNAQSRFQQFRLSYELEQRNKELTKVAQLKSNFFANVSHELRTPLTLILSPVQDLLSEEENLPEKINRVLFGVRENGLRLLKLVNDLLDVIRLEEGRMQLKQQPIEVDSFLKALVDSVKQLAQSQNVRMRTHLQDHALTIFADQYALEKIILNLLNNATKFSKKGGTIDISSQLESGQVVVKIKDNGIGIAAAELPFIFDRFRQVDSSSTRQYQGSGLGLSLVKDLVEQQQGSVAIESELGKGTSVTVSFPLYYPKPHERVLQLQNNKPDTLSRLYGMAERSGILHLEAGETTEPDSIKMESHGEQKPRVLVVEDEIDLRNYLIETLQEQYEVLYAENGEQALEQAFAQKPDLMVLDLMLPKMDGLEVCSRLKQDPEARFIKIVLLTARVDENAKITALNKGADDFLTKPFSTLELKTRLYNLWQSAKLEKGLFETNQELTQTLNLLKETQSQLIQSEKINALEYLSAGILHEINNPLNYTLTALQLASNSSVLGEDENLKEVLGDISDGMHRIKDIICDLQTFAYPTEVEKQSVFNLNSAIRTALNFTSHEAQYIQITLDLPEEYEVLGSKNHIIQVLVNLLTNAIKAINGLETARQGLIDIKAEKHNGRVKLSVRDNGFGIDPDNLDKVFDPFFTTREVGEGMGLGLSVCHTIIKNHHGKLRVNSEKGNWTEFSFDLLLANDRDHSEKGVEQNAAGQGIRL